MSTITAAKSGNWSDTTVWNGGVVPDNGDTADLNGFIVAMDIATIPASGTLLELISPAKAGQLALVMSEANVYAINATTITAGTKTTGLINVSGAAPSAVLTVTGNITGGSATSAYSLYNNSTGTVVVTGNITGGSGTNTYGIRNGSTGAVTVTGNITGGSGATAYGLYNNSTGTVVVTGNITGGSGTNTYGLYNISTGAVTLNNCNMINSVYTCAYAGQTPTTWNLDANNYVQWGAVKFYQDVPSETNVTEDDTVAGVTGTYHEATEAEVQNGVMFGAESALEGTYAGGGGGGRPEIRGGNL